MNYQNTIDLHTIVSPAKAAELLAVKPTTLRQWRARNQGPRCHKFSGHSYFYPLFPLLIFGLTRLIATTSKGKPAP